MLLAGVRIKATDKTHCVENRSGMDRPRGSGRGCSRIQTRPQTFSDRNDPSSRAPVSPAVLRLGICGRVFQWLLSGWRGAAFETCPAPTCSRSTRRTSPPDLNDHLGCKACREWHVACDGAWPQCSHCWQQQILCFYVHPRRKSNSKKAKHRAVVETAISNVQEDRA